MSEKRMKFYPQGFRSYMQDNHPEELHQKDERRVQWLRTRFQWDTWFVISSLLMVAIGYLVAFYNNQADLWVLFGIILAFEFIVLLSYFSDWQLMKRIEHQ